MKYVKEQLEKKISDALGNKETFQKLGWGTKAQWKDEAIRKVIKGGNFRCDNYKCGYEWRAQPFEIPDKCPKCNSDLLSLELNPDKKGIRRSVGFYDIEKL